MLGTIYLFVLVPLIALVGGFLAVRSSEREAERIRAAEAQRKPAAV